MSVVDKYDVVIKVGDHVKCMESLRQVNQGKVYKVLGVQPEANRVVVHDDDGVEQWLRASRFVVSNEPIQLEFEGM